MRICKEIYLIPENEDDDDMINENNNIFIRDSQECLVNKIRNAHFQFPQREALNLNEGKYFIPQRPLQSNEDSVVLFSNIRN